MAAPVSAKKKTLIRRADSPLASYDWFKYQVEVYRPAGKKGIGVVVGEKHKEKLREETSLFNGVVYVALRKPRVYREMSFRNGKIALDRDGKPLAKDITPKQFLQAGIYISQKSADEVKKAWKHKNAPWTKTYVREDEGQFRLFVIM